MVFGVLAMLGKACSLDVLGVAFLLLGKVESYFDSRTPTKVGRYVGWCIGRRQD